jgi:hypothetical protein
VRRRRAAGENLERRLQLRADIVSRLISLRAGAISSLLFVTLLGCASSEAPDQQQSPTFAAVQAVFDANCTACHNPSTALTPGIQRYPELPLTSGLSYAALVDRPAHESCGGTLVTPGSTAASYLVHKLTEETPCEGGEMPLGGEAIRPQPLPQADLEIITAWIAAGAPP